MACPHCGAKLRKTAGDDAMEIVWVLLGFFVGLPLLVFAIFLIYYILAQVMGWV